MKRYIRNLGITSFLFIPLLSASPSTYPFTNDDYHKKTLQPIVGEAPQEAAVDLANTPFAWRLKRGIHNALFAQAVNGNVTDAHKPLPEIVVEDHDIVPFKELGFPLEGVYTLKNPPAGEASITQKLGSKALTFLLNYLSIDSDNLPVVPKDHNTLMEIILPDAYVKFLPRPGIPREIADYPGDILAGTALSGPFANRIAKANQRDLVGSPFEGRNTEDFFVIDLNEYSRFPVIDKYEKLGGKALLKYNRQSQRLETKSIFYEGVHYTPADEFWPQLQKIMMATHTTDTAMIRHLLQTHVIMAGLFSAVVHTAFPVDHPLLAFLYPHIYGTIATNNYKLSILIGGEGSMFPSLFNFDEKGIHNILQKNIDDFDIFKLDVKADLEERGMLPTQETDMLYSYGDITLKLWELTTQYVEEAINTLYPTDSDISSDTRLLNFYNLLAQYVPNDQLKQYAPTLDRENLGRLLTLYIYHDSVEHYIVGTMTYYFQLNANEIPFSVRRDGIPPSIGEAQNAANLIFATQPTSIATLAVDRTTDTLPETGLKLAMKNYQTTLLQMQAAVEGSMRSGTSSTSFNFKAMRTGVNS
jgi:hypothetical protein